MSEEWRRRRYYRTRVLISTQDVLESPFPDGLLCLSGGQLNIIRNLLQYATRRANFVSTYETDTYLTPTEEEWDAIQAIVADLEEQAMGDCSELMSRLDDLLAAVECICPSLLDLRSNTVLSPDSLNTDEITDVFEWSDNVPNPTVESEEETAACAIAQLWYQAGFETITEAVLPAMKAAYNVLLALVAAKVATMTGGATLPTLLGAVTVADLVSELLLSGWDSAESNVYNFMVSSKEDIVCELYSAVKAGGTASSCWAEAYDNVIAPSGDISAGDKAMLWLFMGHIGYVIAYYAYNAETSWATANVTPGYCSSCPLDPIVGSNWVALPLVASGPNVVTLVKVTTNGQGCWIYPIPSGRTVVGFLCEVTYNSGSSYWKSMSAVDGGCAGAGSQLTGNTSESNYHAVGTWYCRSSGSVSEAEVIAAVHPGAVALGDGNAVTGTNAVQGLQNGGAAGTKTLTFRYAVLSGTAIPE